MIATKSIILLVVVALAMYHFALRTNNPHASTSSSCQSAFPNSIMATAWNRCLHWNSNDHDTGNNPLPKKKYGYFLHITDMHVSDTMGCTKWIKVPSKRTCYRWTRTISKGAPKRVHVIEIQRRIDVTRLED